MNTIRYIISRLLHHLEPGPAGLCLLIGIALCLVVVAAYGQSSENDEEPFDRLEFDDGVLTSYNERGVETSSWKVLTVSATGGAQFSTIQDAIDAVPEGRPNAERDRYLILIRPGVYETNGAYRNAPVLIPANKPYVTLRGLGRDAVIIRHPTHNALVEGDIPVHTRADHTTFENLTVQNPDATGAFSMCMFIGQIESPSANVTGVKLRNVHLKSNPKGRDTIWVRCDNFEMRECVVDGVSDTFCMQGADDVRIRDSVIYSRSGDWAAFWIANCTNVKLTSIRVTGSRFSILPIGMNSITIRGMSLEPGVNLFTTMRDHVETDVRITGLSLSGALHKGRYGTISCVWTDVADFIADIDEEEDSFEFEDSLFAEGEDYLDMLEDDLMRSVD